MAIGCDVFPYRLSLRRRLASASGSLDAREGWLLRLRTEDGRIGWGDAAPYPGHSRESLAESRADLQRLCDLLGSRAVSDADLPRTLPELVAFHGSMGGDGPAAPSAVAALDLALADLASQSAGLSLARWMSAWSRAGVWVNALIGVASVDRASRAARAAVETGFRSIKVKVGTDDVSDLQRVAAVRAAVGRRAEVRVDANGAWDPIRAEVMLDALAPHGVAYAEQPVAAGEIEALARLRREGAVPVGADESLLRPGGVERILELEAADVLVLKPSLLGGPSAAWALAERAGRLGMGVVVTSALESAIGRAGALHLAAALPGHEHAAGLATGDWLAEDVAEAPPIVRGRMDVPKLPGLGVRPVADWPLTTTVDPSSEERSEA